LSYLLAISLPRQVTPRQPVKVLLAYDFDK
jgi:hypothetical protein